MKKSLISLTFDDGYLSQYHYTSTLLKEYGYKGTFYIVTEYLNKDDPNRMLADHVKELYENGHEIGSHSVSHPSLPYHFWKNRNNEIQHSKDALEDLLDGPIKSFAYPYGRYDKKIIEIVQAVGYENARTVSGGKTPAGHDDFNHPGTRPFEICCKSVKKTTTGKELDIWIEIAKKNNYWLVLNFHQIMDKPPKWGCTPGMLSLACDLIRAYDMQVEPLSKAKDLYFQKELVH